MKKNNNLLKSVWLHLSDYASLSAGNKLNIEGIFEEFRAVKLPAVLPRFFISGSFLGLPLSLHTTNIKIISPSGTEVASIKGPEVRPGDNGKLNLMIEVVNLPLKEEGFYTIQIVEDKDVVGRLDFKVVLVDSKKGNESQ
jgi:hypothetical protein